MKLIYISLALVIFAACQPAAEREQKSPVAADSLAIAIENMRTDLRIQPDDANLRIYLANALTEHGDYAAADSQAAILAQRPATLPNALYVRGLIALKQHDTLTSLKHLKAAINIQRDSSEYEAVMLTAEMEYALRGWDEALHYYTLAGSIDSTSAEAVYGGGQVLEMQQKLPLAASAYNRALQRDPAFSPAYIALGNMEVRKHDQTAALGYFNMAAKADPTNADAFYLRGRTLLQLGNKPAGMDDLTKALSFRKHFPAAQQLLDSVKNH